MAKKCTLAFIFVVTALFTAHAQFKQFKGLIPGKKGGTEEAKADTAKTKKSKGGTGFMGKMMMKMAGAAAKAAGNNAVAVSNLDEVIMTGSVMHNLRDKSVGTADMTFLGGWISGGNATTLSFALKNNFGFAKIDGSVKVDGSEVESGMLGTYAAFANANPSSPKKIEITTSTGQRCSFTAPALKETVKLLTVNGQKKNPSIDFTKDVTLELELNSNYDTKTPVQVYITAKAVGISTLYCVGTFEPQTKLVVPAAFFKNIGMTPGTDAVANFSNIYLEIWRPSTVKPTDLSGNITINQFVVATSDGTFVNVVKEPEVNRGIKAKGFDKFDDGGMEFSLLKPNAYYSRPSTYAMKAGVMSLSIMGTTYATKDLGTTTHETRVGNYIYTDTYQETLTAQFPRVSNELWDEVLQSLYVDFTKAMTNVLGTEFIPIEAVTGSKAYAKISPLGSDDENVKEHFKRSYKNTVVMSKLAPFTTTIGGAIDLMQETKTNALVNMTMKINLTFDGKKPVMVPEFTIEMIGRPNGDPDYLYSGPTKFFEGKITGTGVRFPKDDLTKEDLDKVIRKSSLLEIFQRSLKELKEKETANDDYKMVWNNNFYR